MKTLTIRLRDDDAANAFAGHFSSMDPVVSVLVEGNVVTLRSEDPRLVAMVREMQEDSKMRSMADSMLKAIVECLTDKTLKQVTFMDGSVGRMTRQQAQVISRVHDRLDESNRAAFLILASQDKYSFDKVVEFSRRNEGEVA
jgi:hypothetical protein